MFKFNVERIVELRGIEKPVKFLMTHGFTYQQAATLLSGEMNLVRLWQLERLCDILNCTPNDLMSWTPDAKRVLPAAHSLNTLQKPVKQVNIQQIIKDIPIEKLDEFENMVTELKKRRGDE